jgi:2-polyprenyl-6-hydroxyphenyl methylase/3-demethylubiquinone-9 3-methyltransferase
MKNPTDRWAEEVRTGERFRFGENWAAFLPQIDEARIEQAEQSLLEMLGIDGLAGKRFLDAGSGSGLFSLAARRLGADVVSFDFDPESVRCTAELKRLWCQNDDQWRVDQGSVLDGEFLDKLGTYDIVYSWGVLHHTGSMWQALENIASLVVPGGQLFISIYNDQGARSRFWLRVKRLYVRTPRPFKWMILLPSMALLWGPAVVRRIFSPTLHRSVKSGAPRGMSRWRDAVDWVGGYPFEVARPEEILDFYSALGFRIRRIETCGDRIGCNEFVFTRGEGR